MFFQSIVVSSPCISSRPSDDDILFLVSLLAGTLYASSVLGDRDAQELAVILTNEYYNKNWNELGTRHPQLQWQLLCATHNAKSNIRKHQWIGFKQKKGNNNSLKLLQQIYPNMKQDEVELLARLSTKKELKELAKEHNIDIKL